jgi:hypothetical protein
MIAHDLVEINSAGGSQVQKAFEEIAGRFKIGNPPPRKLLYPNWTYPKEAFEVPASDPVKENSTIIFLYHIKVPLELETWTRKANLMRNFAKFVGNFLACF